MIRHEPEGLPPRWRGGAIRGGPTTEYYVACLRSTLAHLIYHAEQFSVDGANESELWVEVKALEELLITHAVETKNYQEWPTLFKAEHRLWNLLRGVHPLMDDDSVVRFAEAPYLEALRATHRMLPLIDLMYPTPDENATASDPTSQAGTIVVPSPNSERDKFIYDQCRLGKTNKEIRTAIKAHGGWGLVSTDQAINGALDRYCKKYELDRPVRHKQPLTKRD